MVFTVSNTASVRSGPFWLRPSVRVNGEKSFDPPVDMISLDAGQSETYEFSRSFESRTEDWKALIIVDISNFVDEADESNNVVTFSFAARPTAVRNR